VHKGLKTNKTGGKVLGFELAGNDQEFKPAKAVIKGKTVILSAGDIDNPVAVRYNWADDAGAGNLFNGADFPAAPFRTDNWKGITEDTTYKFVYESL
jgi:sialate O-acetylesterase